MDRIDLLEGVLAKTGDLIEGVQDHHADQPTPCEDYDVDTLVNHLVGWVQVFGAASQGRTFEGDASAYTHGDDPAAEFRASAAGLVAGWREHGFDRTVRISGGDTPGEMAFNMTLMEYVTHGMDLAVATGQPIPYTEEEAAETLARAEMSPTTPPPSPGSTPSSGAPRPERSDGDRAKGIRMQRRVVE